MKLPGALEERIVCVHGERGRLWLADLPALLDEFRERWSLELGEPFAELSYNLVFPARDRQGTDVVLKLGVLCDELLTEASALASWEGEGAVRLLAHDAARGALLLERALPGAPLYTELNDAEATREAARLMRRLWREAPPGHAFPSLARWFRAFERLRQNFDSASGPFPVRLAARAEQTFLELNATAGREVLLHGDLHHMNVLSSARGGWLAIDPKGICGDPGYEVGPFMLNRLPDEATDDALRETFRRRLSIFSEELNIERRRLARWAFCHAMLSALWDLEESADWSRTVRLARLLGEL